MKISDILIALVVLIDLIVISTALTSKPESTEIIEGPVYSGHYRGLINNEYFTYKSVSGRLSLDTVPFPRSTYGGEDKDSLQLFDFNCYVLHQTIEDENYIILSRNHKPTVDKLYEDYLGETIIVQGNVALIDTGNGSVLRVIEPIEIHTEPSFDVVESSKNVIQEVLGERYFREHFSRPILWKDVYEPEPERIYQVEYYYQFDPEKKPPVRNVEFIFNEEGKLVDQRGLPDSNSKHPYSISKDRAIEIAQAHGFPNNPDANVSFSTYTKPHEWERLSEKVQLETYSNSWYTSGQIELTHYLWKVSLEMTPKGSNPVKYENAIIDVNSGEFYTMYESGFGFIETSAG